MPRVEELRLITKVARMYYEQGLRQPQITDRLGIHQSTVSRLLGKARKAKIVRISVVQPEGTHPDLEQALEAKFNLVNSIIVDTSNDEDHLLRDLGAAAAFFVQAIVKPGMVLGISSWSRALIAMVDVLDQSVSGRGGKVVQILGGVGNGRAQAHATHLAQQLASSIGATPVLLQAPGLVQSPEAARVLSRDRVVRDAAELFPKMDVALVGIGALEPSKLLAKSGNTFLPQERAELARLGAVGDICLRFFDKQGMMVRSPLTSRVIGIEPASLRRVPRVVGLAGGPRKETAIHAALLGGWVNVLITDKGTAQRLLRTDCLGCASSSAAASGSLQTG